MPSVADPATMNASMRQQICDDIANSGIFHLLNFVPVDTKKIFNKRNNPTYSAMFHRLYISTNGSYKYENQYTRQTLRVSVDLYEFEEYLFVCPLKSLYGRDIIPFYISKEYDVSSLDEHYMPARFVFKRFLPGHPNAHYYTLLAEQPANVHAEPDFNVEIHYLQMRKYIEPGKMSKINK